MGAPLTDTPRHAGHGRAIALAITCSSLAIAACGSSSKPASKIASSAPSAEVKFASCMRSHGVPSFRDPTASGAGPPAGTIDKRSPAVVTAMKTCSTEVPGLVALATRQAPGGQSLAAQVRFASCMRSHGVPSFPDPVAGGAPVTAGTVDKQLPAVIAAANACGKPLSSGGSRSARAP